jgi:hypothetical protein
MRRSTRNALWGNLLFALSQSLSFFVIALVFWYGAGLVSHLEASTTAFFVALMVRNYTGLHLSSILMSLRARQWEPFRPGTSSHLYQTYPQQAAQVLTSSAFSTQSPKSTQTPRLERFLIPRPPKATFDSRTFVFNTRHVLRFLPFVISLWKPSLGHILQWSAPVVQGKALCKNYPSKLFSFFDQSSSRIQLLERFYDPSAGVISVRLFSQCISHFSPFFCSLTENTSGN